MTPPSETSNKIRWDGDSSLRSGQSLLDRASVSPSAFFSPLQSQVDGLVGSFVHQATDLRSLAAMAAGGMAYRAGRIGAMGLGSGHAVRALSIGAGLTAEVSTFELTHRSLHSIGGASTSLNAENANLWRWAGSGGIRQGLLQSFITFGSLKSAGRMVRGENLIAQHLLQDTAMVFGHQASAILGAGSRPAGTLAEQFLHAEATNLQIGAGMSLAHRVAPGIQALERGLDLSLRTTDVGAAPRGRPQLAGTPIGMSLQGEPALATAGQGRGARGLDPLGIQIAAMSSNESPDGKLPLEGGPLPGGEPASGGGPSPDGRAEASTGVAQRPPSPVRVLSAGELAAREGRLQAFLNEHSYILEDFYNSDRDISRLHDAMLTAHGELQNREVNRGVFLSRVVELLKSSEWERGNQYRSAFSVVNALVLMRRELAEFLTERIQGPESEAIKSALINDSLRFILNSYPLDAQGGLKWGVQVGGGEPQRALWAAINSVKDLAGYDLKSSAAAQPLSERLGEARGLLEAAGVRLVPVLGAGRHGLALGHWMRMAAGKSQKIGEHYLIPIMLGRSLDFVYELHVHGGYSVRLPDRIINSKGRLGLRSVHPRLNPAYLALGDTIITTLDSSNLEKAFTPELIRRLSPDATVLPAIKSVMNTGESIPEWFLTRFARQGRFDLMYHFNLQSGLGFPREMLGGNAPEAPVNLRLDSISKSSRQRAARLLLGDRSVRFVAPENGESYRAPNRNIEVGEDLFIAAYWAFVKNFMSPGVGYRFQQRLIEEGPRAKPQDLVNILDGLVEEALRTAESTFFDYELPALKREIRSILEAMDGAQRDSQIEIQGREREQEIRDFLNGFLAKPETEIRQSLLEHTTGIEDLLGCTRIRDMAVYQRIVWDVLEARGDTFERRLAEHLGRVRSQASSQNFAFGLLEPTILSLLRKGMILRRPDWKFTVEGIVGLPHAERRWGGRPSFVEETLRWVSPESLPRPTVESHPSGMRHHAFDVARDRIKQMEDQLLKLRRTRARRMSAMGPQDLLAGFRIGHGIVDYLRNDMKDLPPRDPQELNIALNDLENGLFELEKVTRELTNPFDHAMINGRIHPFLDHMQEILVHLRSNFDAGGDLTYWRNNRREILRLFVRAARNLSGSADSPAEPDGSDPIP